MATGSVNRASARAAAHRLAKTFVAWLVEPFAAVDERQRRRLRLLSAFLLLMAANTYIGAAMMGEEESPMQAFMMVTASILTIGYGLSRTRYYGVATLVAISIPAVPIVAMLTLGPEPGAIAQQFPWLALPLLISSLLLSLRGTIIIASAYVLVISALTFSVGVPVPNSAESLAYILMIIFFVVVITAIRHQDQREIERQLHEREQAEEALRDSEEKFSSAFKNSPSSICIVSVATGNFTEINESFARFIGYPPQEIIGHTPNEMHLFVSEEELNRMATELQENNRIYNQEFQSRRKSGRSASASSRPKSSTSAASRTSSW